MTSSTPPRLLPRGARTAGYCHCRLAAADQPVRRTACRHKRSGLGFQYESDWLGGRCTVHAVCAGAVVPATYLKMGTTTIPQLMEARFGRGTKLMFSFVIVVMYSILNLPVILYSGAVVFENIFDISGIFGISKFQAVAILCVVIGIYRRLLRHLRRFEGGCRIRHHQRYRSYHRRLMIPFLALTVAGSRDHRAAVW